MTLRKKTLTIITITLLCLFTLLYSVTRFIFLGSVTMLEEDQFRKNIERALAVMENEVKNLDVTTLDWAGWDETYSFMGGTNPDYIDNNLMDSAFTTLRLNLVAYVDNLGEVLYAQAYDFDSDKAIPVPPGFYRHLFAGSPLFSHQHTQSSTSGIIMLDDTPLLFVSRPVLTSIHQGPIRGALIMGRFLDETICQHLSSMLRLPVTVHPYDSSLQLTLLQLPVAVHHYENPLQATIKEDPTFSAYRILREQHGRDSLSGYTVLNDIYDNPALFLHLEMPRDVFRIALAGVRNIVVVIVIIGLVFSLVIMVTLEKTVLSPVARVTNLAIAIGETGDISKRLRVEPGNDELSRLSGKVNNMLERLEQSRLVIAEREARLRLVTDNMLDTISQVDMKGNLLYASPSHKTLLGYRIEDMVRRQFLDFVHPDDREMVLDAFNRSVCSLQPFRAEFRYLHADGHDIWAEGIGRIIYDDNGRPAGGVISCRDISERKQMEEMLKYLSLHDALTGLYNRTYFEQEMQRLKSSRITTAGLIICDVDGLKLFNDSLGHPAGDLVLKAAAHVISGCFRTGDMVARIGGDEFAVLLPDTTAEAVEGACRRLREALRAYNEDNPDLPLSISLGFAITHNPAAVDDLFKEADDNMYREKLHSSQSARSATVQTLMKALEARDFITEGHADRLQALVVALAQATGLPETKTADLRLFARFHDIGKVGIPDRILFKKGRLSKTDAAVMQRHCEIGHRIALAAPDLQPIADWILKHHEWWDGNGYPFGLKGEEIPLECRILAIADAYDALTSDRPYRKAVSHEEAVAELKKCAGTQFDPVLVELFTSILDASVIDVDTQNNSSHNGHNII